MSEEKRRILDLLAQGKITVEEAEKLLAALDEPSGEAAPAAAGPRVWKYLRVQVEPGPNSEEKERVNIRVPFKLIKAGLKFAAFIPQAAQGPINEALKDKGVNIDLSKISYDDLMEIVANLDDMAVEVDGKDKVRIYCE
jgi:hypothetical protein